MKQRFPIRFALLMWYLVQAGCSPGWKEIHPGVRFMSTDLPVQELAFDRSGRYLALNFTVPHFLGEPSEKLSVWDLDANQIVDIVPSTNDNFRSLSWHPERNAAVFASRDIFSGLGMIDIENLERTTLSPFGSYSWTPDANKVIVETSEQLSTLDLSNGNQDFLWEIGELISQEGFDFSGFEVSPDGKTLVASIRDFRGSLTDNHLILLSVTSHRHSFLLQNHYPIYSLGWRPDGEWITFTVNTEGVREAFALEVSTGCISLPLPINGVDDITWSKDGSTMALATNSREGHHVYFVDASSEFFEDWLDILDCQN